jgi:drug/metabolite transporter (DMT)-like permease
MSYRAERRLAIGLALGSAALFGVSAPAAKALLAVTDPWLLAGLLYLGSGVSLGLGIVGRRTVTGARPTEAPLSPGDWPWLSGAILTGGLLAPVLLMFGLSRGSAAESALLLNLEGVFTALLAWVVFHEHVDRRIAAGMIAISTGAVVLAWNPVGSLILDLSSLMVAGACLAWALDNNLTRRVSAGDPIQIAALKGLVAGVVNTTIALTWDPRLPGLTTIAGAALLGVVSYGASLVLYILALRGLGAGRTSAYFSVAPFVGAVVGVAMLGEPASARFIVAGMLMGVGVWLHVTERHEHEHHHEPIEHEHRHHHDEHHQHAHPAGTPTRSPHTHWHAHGPLHHSHPHFPDLHHRHGH